jgi:hypothetical protein
MTRLNMNDPYTTLDNSAIQIGKTVFHPWPEFQISGLPVDVPQRLHDMLTSSGSIPIQWRANIPEDVRAALLKFNVQLLPQLMAVAQRDPGKFVDWANFCPALIVLALHHCSQSGKVDEEKVFRLMHFGWRTTLVEVGWPCTRSTIRILQKLKPGYTNSLLLGQLKMHLLDRQKLRLLRHLKHIDSAIIDTLHLPSETLSVRLLELASERAGIIGAHSMLTVCEMIMYFRKEVRQFPVWPYRNGHLSSETFFHAEQLILMHQSMKNLNTEIRFPMPPVETFQSSKFEARPIRIPSELYQEGILMRNCLPGYADRIASGSYFAYRLMKPERASLLLYKSGRGWMPWQLKTISNGNPKSSTVRMVQAWLGESFPGEEVEDAPF